MRLPDIKVEQEPFVLARHFLIEQSRSGWGFKSILKREGDLSRRDEFVFAATEGKPTVLIDPDTRRLLVFSTALSAYRLTTAEVLTFGIKKHPPLTPEGFTIILRHNDTVVVEPVNKYQRVQELLHIVTGMRTVIKVGANRFYLPNLRRL